MTDELEELEETEGEEPFDFPSPERKINTQPYDLSVQTLLEQWNRSCSEFLRFKETMYGTMVAQVD